MQITFKTGKGELLFVKVPEGANVWINPYIPNFLHIGDIHGDAYSQNIGNGFDLIGLSSEVTEEMAKELIPNSHYENIYPDYNFITDRMRAINFFNNALDSFKSILGHLEIDFNPIVLFKPNNN